MSVKLQTENHLEFLSLKGDCTGSLESTLVKLPHFWKSHVTAQIMISSGQKALFQPNISHFVKKCAYSKVIYSIHAYSSH